MKKKMIILLSAMVICLIGIIVWYNVSLNLTDLVPDEVMEIVVFNGNSGNGTHIEDKGQFQYSIDDLNDIEVKRTKPPCWLYRIWF